jgi:hypothetical protein
LESRRIKTAEKGRHPVSGGSTGFGLYQEPLHMKPQDVFHILPQRSE